MMSVKMFLYSRILVQQSAIPSLSYILQNIVPDSKSRQKMH